MSVFVCSLQYGNAPLHLASYRGRSDMVNTLLAAGAEKDAVDNVRLICFIIIQQ